MEIEILTKHDLEVFRQKLMHELAEFIVIRQTEPKKEYLRSKEVRDILKVSSGTLQSLRIGGKLNPSKIGGIFYYSLKEVQALLDAGTGA